MPSSMDCIRPKDPTRRRSKELDKKIANWMKQYRKSIKLLLLGAGESGKTTIIKQMKIIHIQGFTAEERKEKVYEIRRNILEAIKELALNLQYSEPEAGLADPKNEPSFEYVMNLDTKSDRFDFTKEFYEHAKKLWLDAGIQRVYDRSHEFSLIDSAKYFLDKIDEIAKENFMPSDQDILCCRKRTSDIQRIEFEVKIPMKYGGGTQQFWMFDVGGQRGERRKWIQVFDGITAVVFLVACNEFDMVLREDNETNRLVESLRLFEEVWSSRFLRSAGFILFLNKQDLLKRKIESGASIANYFPEYLDYHIPHGLDQEDEYAKTKYFIRDQFLDLTQKVPDHRKFSTSEYIYFNNNNSRHHECYTHFTTATDTNNIKTVFDDIHTMIIIWNLKSTLPA